MSAPVAVPPRGGVHASAVTTPVEGRRPAPWLTIAAVIAVFSGLLLVLALFLGAAFRSWPWPAGLSTSFGLVPLLGWDTAVATGVAGLVVAVAIVLTVTLSRHRTPGGMTVEPGATLAGDGSSDPRVLRRVVMIAVAAALVAGSVLFFSAFAGMGLGYGYGLPGRVVLIGAGAIALLGIASAVVVGVLAVLPGSRARATSLRTRSFVVLVVAMIAPSVLLAALGAYAYMRVWDSAASLRAEQTQYSAARLADDVRSLRSAPDRLSPAARARVGEAIVKAYAAGNTGGAWRSTMADVKRLHVLPRWAIRGLARHGHAVGALDGGVSRGSMPDIVAWRSGPREVRYFTTEALSEPFDYYGHSPIDRGTVEGLLVLGGMGLAVVVVLGLLGAWVLSRGVVRPVRRLAEASGRLAEGEAGVTVTPEGPRELRELAVAFNDMNAKMAKAQETEQAFLLSVSHELKTPLTSIRGYAEGIGDGTVEADQGAAVIGVESARLERLVGDLLESGRMRKAAFTVRREAVDLAAVAADVTRRYEVTAHDAGLTLLLNTEAGGGAVADHDRVLQVVSNLVENAIRCTPAPGTVTIATAPGTITVSDTGRGLTSDDLPRAFERFYLYSRYGTDRPVGTGLGLAIVKELTEAMGGKVSVSSAVGVGTAFTVALPVGPPSGPAATAVTAALDTDPAGAVMPGSDAVVTPAPETAATGAPAAAQDDVP